MFTKQELEFLAGAIDTDLLISRHTEARGVQTGEFQAVLLNLKAKVLRIHASLKPQIVENKPKEGKK